MTISARFKNSQELAKTLELRKKMLRLKLNTNSSLVNFLDECEAKLGTEGSLGFYKTLMPKFNKSGNDVGIFIDVIEGNEGADIAPHNKEKLRIILNKILGV